MIRKYMICMIAVCLSTQIMQASYYHHARQLLAKSMIQVQQTVSSRYNKSKQLMKFSDKRVQSQLHNAHGEQHSVHGQQPDHKVFMPHAPQAGNSGDVRFAQSNGWINASKSSNATTNNITYHNYYGKKAWHQTFKEWIDTGNHKRAASVGFTAGILVGYGLHATTAAKPEEKIIVVRD